MGFETKKWLRSRAGYLIHDGDCYKYVNSLCTCGLLHHLLPLSDASIEKEKPDFFKEYKMHAKMLDLLGCRG